MSDWKAADRREWYSSSISTSAGANDFVFSAREDHAANTKTQADTLAFGMYHTGNRRNSVPNFHTFYPPKGLPIPMSRVVSTGNTDMVILTLELRRKANGPFDTFDCVPVKCFLVCVIINY